MRDHYTLLLPMRFRLAGSLDGATAVPSRLARLFHGKGRGSLVIALFAICLGACYIPPQGEPDDAGPQPTGDAAGDTVDPPSRVGRLDLVEGTVSFRPAAADTWALADLNRPVTTGDRLWVDTTGRAEVEVGPNAIRAGHETELDITHLDDDLVQLSVPEGVIELRVNKFRVGGEYEVDAPNAAVNPQQEGEYRVDVSADGDTSRITVRSGLAEVTAAGSSFEVNQGQAATVIGQGSPTYDITDAASPDAFDEWASDRDRQEERETASARYLPTDISGLDELDADGRWATASVCGPVWYPNDLAPGWAPYRFGRWVWIDPWGWNWIESEPWGWAPFHYGRWAFIDGAWGWCPGDFEFGAVYAPGLVTFIGGPGWAAGPYWGWYPLGWGEPWIPPYRVGPFYRRRINGPPGGPRVPYRNRGIPGAVTVVPSSAFERAELASRVEVHVPPGEIASARVVGSAPEVVPSEASLAAGIGGDRLGPRPPEAALTRPVVALRAPPPPRVPFAAERGALASLNGRPLPEDQVRNLRASLAPNALASRRTFTPATVPAGEGATLRPARPGLSARPALPAASGRRVSAGRSPLDESYEQERQALMSRHMEEFAHPNQDESEVERQQRQEAERRELESRYNTARSAHMTRMPAPRAAPRGGGGRR
jgi:hypothetical protein